MGNILDTPVTEKVHRQEFMSSSGINCGAAGMQGFRVNMEDTHILTDLPKLKDHTLLAIFDGHGGSSSAEFAEKNLVEFLENTSEYKRYTKEKDLHNVELLGQAIRQAFLDVDNALWDVNTSESGCTAVVAVMTPHYIICANAGDSRCVLGTRSNTTELTKPLSQDHKPTVEGERKRIENANGKVIYNRVDGDLAVSRALGDFGFKKRGVAAEKQKVSCVPDITVHSSTAEDDVLILACDGVWDVMSSEDCVCLAREIFESGESNMLLVAEEIIDTALNKDSKDNISVVIAQLPGAKIGPSSGGGVLARRAALKDTNSQRY